MSIASDKDGNNSPLVFGALFPYTLQLKATLKNNGVYKIYGNNFFYDIEAQGRHCNWPVVLSQSINGLDLYSLEAYSTFDIEAKINFVAAECACASNDDVSNVTLRFNLFQGSGSSSVSYEQSSIEVNATIDCSLSPALPALAFYVRPYNIDVNPWCVSSGKISKCPESSGVQDLGADDVWFVHTETELSVGQVNNPPDLYNNIDLSTFPLPQHSFYLLPASEGINKSNTLMLNVSSDWENSASDWAQHQNNYL